MFVSSFRDNMINSILAKILNYYYNPYLLPRKDNNFYSYFILGYKLF